MCFEVKLTNGENGRYEYETWNMGSCSKSLFGVNGNPYESTYQRCCLTPKKYTLECRDSYEFGMDGWNGGALEIFGQKYCDDFVDETVKRKITIQGRVFGYDV